MKKLMTALALTAMAASPALAKTYHQTGNPQQPQLSADAYDSYASADVADVRGPAVIANGKYAGWDPDANVRLQLMRDPGAFTSN